MKARTAADPVKELRYALEVMEENSHLGLDDNTASMLRKILVRRIQHAEEALSPRPAEQVRFPVAEKASA
jgi:hypothetical protein